MSNMENFHAQAPARIGLVGHLEDTLAQKMGPTVTARFGHRLPGFSGVTLPGSGQNIRAIPRAFWRHNAASPDLARVKLKGGDMNGDGKREVGIGSKRLQKKGIYW